MREEILRIIKLPNQVSMQDAIYVITHYIYQLKNVDVLIIPRPYENEAVSEAYNIAKKYFMNEYSITTLKVGEILRFVD